MITCVRMLGGVGLAALVVGLAAAGARPARAGFLGVTGKGAIIPPGSGGALPNFFDDPAKKAVVHGWEERQGAVLAADVYVDIVAPGTYAKESDLAGFEAAKVAAGTRVSSHLLYFDPKGGASVDGVTFTFDGRVLGVIVESDRFFKKKFGFTDYYVESDFLRNPATPAANYPVPAGDPSSHFNNRGLEFNTDSIVVGSNFVTLNLSASDPGDQVRVITAAVPEPASLTAAGIGVASLAGYGLRRLRRRTDAA
jgi:hypothetical protein